ncbi:hypothetical protein D9M72_424960 [compost metagenome]
MERLDLVHDPAVADDTARISPGVDRHARFEGLEDALVPPFPERLHVRRVHRKLRFRTSRDVRKRRNVDERGNDGNALVHEPGDVARQQAGSVFDAVDAGVEHVIQGVLCETVGGHPGAFVVGGAHSVPHQCGRERRRKVAGVPVDPVPYELDPAVTRQRLLAYGLDQSVRFHFDGESPEVAARPGDVAAGADDARQLRPLLEPARVVDGAGITDEQRARVPVRDSLLFGDGIRNVTGWS